MSYSSDVTNYSLQPYEMDYSHFGIYNVFPTLESIVSKSPTLSIWDNEASPSSTISNGSSRSQPRTSKFFPISTTAMELNGSHDSEFPSMKEIWDSVPNKTTKTMVVSPKKPTVQPVNKQKNEKKQWKTRLPANKVILQLKPKSV